MAWPIRVGRALALVLVLLAGIGVAAAMPVLSRAARGRCIQGWFRLLLAAAGVRLVVRGRPHSPGKAESGVSGTLFAANHVSWLDIPAVLAVQPMRVLAKTEVRRWPVIGLLAACGGTLFIDRYRLSLLPGTVSGLTGALRQGHDMLVFPEGSTRCGRVQGRFFPATFQAAIDAGATVRPVALRYRIAGGAATTAPAFVGEDTLVASIGRVITARGLVVEVELGPELAGQGAARRPLATATATIIGAAAPLPAAHARTVHDGHDHSRSMVDSPN